jgi:serine/threonine protein kinase
MIDNKFNIILIDFGLACYYPSNEIRLPRLTDFVGTPPYVAPEIVDGSPYIAYNAEIFSLGVCLYVLLYGFVPFKIASNED